MKFSVLYITPYLGKQHIHTFYKQMLLFVTRLYIIKMSSCFDDDIWIEFNGSFNNFSVYFIFWIIFLSYWWKCIWITTLSCCLLWTYDIDWLYVSPFVCKQLVFKKKFSFKPFALGKQKLSFARLLIEKKMKKKNPHNIKKQKFSNIWKVNIVKLSSDLKIGLIFCNNFT